MEHKGEQKDKSTVIRTPDYRLRVFISSTLKELAEEREAARQAILNLRLMPVMFESGARSHPSHELYHAYLSQSHIFVGIYWRSYGWVPEGETISGLEDEFLLSSSIPRLIYIKDLMSASLRAVKSIKHADNMPCIFWILRGGSSRSSALVTASSTPVR